MFAQATFQKTVGGINKDIALGLSAENNGYIISGYTLSFCNGGCADVYLISLSASGEIRWSRYIGGEFSDVSNSVHYANDKIFVTGFCRSSSGVGPGISLLILDTLGNLLQNKLFVNDTTGFSYQGNIISISENGFITIAGRSETLGTDDDILLLKFNSDGDSIFSKKYSSTGNDAANSFFEDISGNIILGGYTTGSGAGSYDFLLIKTDSIGNLIWAKSYGGSDVDQAWSLKPAFDGGYILAGTTRSFGQGNYDVLIIKTDTSGSVLWSRTYGSAGNDYAFSIDLTKEGGYIIGGSSDSFVSDSLDMLLIKIDVAGNFLWSKRYGDKRKEQCTSVLSDADGGYLLSGWTNSFGEGDYDVYIVKTDQNGESGCYSYDDMPLSVSAPTITSTFNPVISGGGFYLSTSINTNAGGIFNSQCFNSIDMPIHKPFDFVISPNPASQSFVLKIQGNYLNIYYLILTDLKGSIILKKDIQESETLIDVSAVENGIYECKLISKSNVSPLFKKLVIIK